MTNLRAQRLIASKLLKRGKNGVWMDPEMYNTISSAIKREDVASLIKNGTIKPRKIKGTSRGRARAQRTKRARGQRRGPGSRKGTKKARTNPKRMWINKIRIQRKYLRKLRDEEYITPATYRLLYRQAKGNMFRSVRYLSNHIRDSDLAIKRIPELK